VHELIEGKPGGHRDEIERRARLVERLHGQRARGAGAPLLERRARPRLAAGRDLRLGVVRSPQRAFSTVAAAVIYFRLVPGALKLDADDIADVFT
jgi:hypothetical protein